MGHVLLVGAGGFLGAAARYLAGLFVHRFLPLTFPYGTFFVNLTGCFAIGFIAALSDERGLVGPEARLFWIAGVLGGYTTFSAFGYETLGLLRDGHTFAALANVLGQVLLGVLAVWLGATGARALS